MRYATVVVDQIVTAVDRLERWAWWWTERPYASMADPSVVERLKRQVTG